MTQLSRLYNQTTPIYPLDYRNLIINGGFEIDQRNAAAAKTINTAAWSYCMDRWMAYGQATDGVFTVQQVTSSLPASGAKNACKITVSTADASIGASQLYEFGQRVEGNNSSQLMYGTSNAKSSVVSFWIRSSVTGTFSGMLKNSAGNRFYVFTFSIGVADTWEKKSVIVPGDTSGTWLSDSGIGLHLSLSLGTGSTYKGTAGVWGATEYWGATGSVDLISTLNATLYLADVQLEAGSAPTDFERLPVDEVLRRCQRYYEKSYDVGTVPGTATAIGIRSTCVGWSTYAGSENIVFKVQKRSAPACSFWDKAGNAGKFSYFYNGTWQGDNVGTVSYTSAGESCVMIYPSANTYPMVAHWTADSEL